MFWIGLIIGAAFATLGHQWMIAFHDAKVINRALEEEWEAASNWAKLNNYPPPPPPNTRWVK